MKTRQHEDALTALADRQPEPGPPRRLRLPRWPFSLAFAGFPLWWLLGVVDFIWILMGAVMLLYLVRVRAPAAPRWFGVWLVFLVWAGLSAMHLSEAGDYLVFGYRYAIYLSCTVLLLYVFNDRGGLTDRFVAGTFTVLWAVTVVGGYLAMLFPTAVLRTPMNFLLPDGLRNNPWINQMVVRRFSQYNPESYFDLAPRPSAPFLYTNNWGNVYSLLVPFVVAYLLEVRGTRRFWLISLAMAASLVPAIYSLNRGMFLGLGIAAVYAAVRMLLMGNVRGLVAVGVAVSVGVVVFQLLPTEDALQARIESPSLDDRASLYALSVDAALESPFFGYGRTLDVDDTGTRDPVGTQGQLWMVLVSHGVGATIFFVTWFAVTFILSLRRQDPNGVAMNTVLLVSTIELAYYGVVPYGLPVMMVAAALALRGPIARGVSG